MLNWLIIIIFVIPVIFVKRIEGPLQFNSMAGLLVADQLLIPSTDNILKGLFWH